MNDDPAAADHLGPLETIDVRLPWSGRRLEIVHPTDLDLLLDRVEADPEQNLPYWAEVWPSGIALADAIACEPGIVRGKRTLELGCGLGITAIEALQAGADLWAVDYFPDALARCRENCCRNTGTAPRTIAANWRALDDGAIDAPGGWPVILAADVLYERRDVEPLLTAIDRLLAPNGVFWLAEPGRPPAAAWLEALREIGWGIESRRHPGPWPDPGDDGVEVGLHRLRRPQSRG